MTMRRIGVARKSETRAPGTSSRDRILQAAKRLFAAKGYENTSTMAIARLAGTSESQLIKHFGSKEGLLEGVFDQAWQRLIPRLQQTVRANVSPDEKLDNLVSLTTNALEKDPDLKLLMLLEGRRFRKEGQMVMLTTGFLEFVRLMDGVLREMRDAGRLRPELHLEGIRSALMGVWEGLMRDQLLARRMGYPARFSSKDIARIVTTVLASFRASAGQTASKSLSAAAGAAGAGHV